jgi:flagellar protein FlaF
MYSFSYNEVVDDSPSEQRARERQAIDKAISMLRVASQKGPLSRELVDALFYLRRLWAIFMDDLNNPDNELPQQVRAGLISIGIWMNKEISRIQSGETTDLMPLIDLNEIIRDGLN